MSKSISLSLWDYINYNDTRLNKQFKQLFDISKLPRDCKSSKKFLNIYMENLTQTDLKFLKDVYNEYFDYKINLNV